MAPPLENAKRKTQSAELKVKIKNLKFLVLSFSFTLYALGFTFICFAQSPKQIRVAIMQDAAYFKLEINGDYEILDFNSKKLLHSDKNINALIKAQGRSVLVGNKVLNAPEILIRSTDNNAIIIDGRKFRGDMELVMKDKRRLLVINHIDVEDYIKGILYHESSHYWPAEVLKAQAVACRTFAYYQMQINASRDYDVTSDVYSQVYGGKTSERSRTNRFVEETKGIILIYNGKVFPAYYHATCAGRTEDADTLWNIDMPALKGRPCGFCKDSPHFSWHNVLSLQEIEDKLRSAKYDMDNIKDILVLERNESGRVSRLRIGSSNKGLEISAKDFRNALGPNVIRSTNFKVNVAGDDAVFEGLGWGHGVGLCQWGAYFMAKKGYKYEEILKYYYPQTELLTM